MPADGGSYTPGFLMPEQSPEVRAWRLASLLPAALVAVPLLVVFAGWLQPESEVWRHLAETVLGDLIANTLYLLVGVGFGVLFLGVGLAWLTAMCEFPGRWLFDWALMLPLAVPAYVLAFVFLGLLDFSGPIQSGLRQWLGARVAFPEVRSGAGVALVMTLVLYPYVYMLARSAFLGQGQGTMDAARVLGLGPWGAFFRVALPMARPAVAAGVSLALMETLADFGTVAVFNYDTFTTAIYKAWFGFFNLQAASQLASLLLVLVAAALLVERRFRGRARYHEGGRGPASHRVRLVGWRRWAAVSACTLVLGVAFVVPLAQLLVWAWGSISTHLDRRYFDLLWHTLSLGAMAALITVCGALILAISRRHRRDALTTWAVSVATLGYALPGSVLAVGIMLTFTGVDNFLNLLLQFLGRAEPGQILGGTLLALLLAYVVRFLAVAYGPVESALDRIRPSLPEAARVLGADTGETIRRVYLPLLRPGLLTAALLVLVDVMKEMPATLLLRPFGWDTLAVRVYELTSEGEWELAALPAVTLVLVGLLPVIVLVRRSAAGR